MERPSPRSAARSPGLPSVFDGPPSSSSLKSSPPSSVASTSLGPLDLARPTPDPMLVKHVVETPPPSWPRRPAIVPSSTSRAAARSSTSSTDTGCPSVSSAPAALDSDSSSSSWPFFSPGKKPLSTPSATAAAAGRPPRSPWLDRILSWLTTSEPSTQALKQHRREAFERAGVSARDPLASAKLHVPMGGIPADAIRPGKGPSPEQVRKRESVKRRKGGGGLRGSGSSGNIGSGESTVMSPGSIVAAAAVAAADRSLMTMSNGPPGGNGMSGDTSDSNRSSSRGGRALAIRGSAGQPAVLMGVFRTSHSSSGASVASGLALAGGARTGGLQR